MLAEFTAAINQQLRMTQDNTVSEVRVVWKFYGAALPESGHREKKDSIGLWTCNFVPYDFAHT